ncbi:MAG: hydrolase [Microbacteriaceae bacterium]
MTGETVAVGAHGDWTVLPGVIDHHVHLGLSNLAQLANSAVVEVHDLGWEPGAIAGWQQHPPVGLTVRSCGRFHTAVGGYPSGRSWAPDGSVRDVTSAADAVIAVSEAVAAGSSAIKITLHTELPLLGDHELHALVRAAHDAGLPAVVHAEGPGQAARAIAAGADALAHTPWTERLDDDTLRAANGMTWLSTLSIHEGDDLERALENARRFVAAGGTLRYGTDMGNGATPVGGVNTREIELLGEAGLNGQALIEAVCGSATEVPVDRTLWAPLPLPDTAPELVSWLSRAERR